MVIALRRLALVLAWIGTLLGGLGVSGGTVDEDCDILHYAMTTVMGEL